MKENTDLLLKLSAALYRLGIEIEKTRRQVIEMIENGCGYESEELKRLVKEHKATSMSICLFGGAIPTSERGFRIATRQS